MKLKSYTKEDLESMSYTELAELILNENGSAMKITDIFKKICKILEMSDAEPEASEDEDQETSEENDDDIFYDSSSDKDDVEDSDDELSDFIMVDEEEEPSI